MRFFANVILSQEFCSRGCGAWPTGKDGLKIDQRESRLNYYPMTKGILIPCSIPYTIRVLFLGTHAKAGMAGISKYLILLNIRVPT